MKRKKKLYPLRFSPFPNPLSRIIFKGEGTLKCCVASEIIVRNSDQEYIHVKYSEVIDCVKPSRGSCHSKCYGKVDEVNKFDEKLVKPLPGFQAQLLIPGKLSLYV